VSILIRFAMVSILALLLASPCLAVTKGGAITKGFGTVAWGENVQGREGFMKLRTVDGIDYFVNLRDRFELKGYGKPTVYYGQASGRLYAVLLQMSGDSGSKGIAEELTKLYGKAKRSHSGNTETLLWKTGPVRIKLKHGEGQMKLAFYYQPVLVTLPAAQRTADPSASALAKLLPPDDSQAALMPGVAPIKQPDAVGIDVLKYLKEGSQLLKLDAPVNHKY